MNHHTKDAVCPLCEDKMKDAHPLIQFWFHEIKSYYPQTHTSCTYRGKKEQDEAYKSGQSKLMWPNSAHNHMIDDGKPFARAMDLFQIRDDNVPSWSKLYYAGISAFLKNQGAPLFWGQDVWGWDAPHFQLQKEVPDEA